MPSWMTRVTSSCVVGRGWVFAQDPERHLGQHIARRDPFGGGLGANAGQAVARLLLVGLAHEGADVGEFVGFAVQLCAQQHGRYAIGKKSAS